MTYEVGPLDRDITGGYIQGGIAGNLKMTHPTAFSIALLAWGLLEFPAVSSCSACSKLCLIMAYIPSSLVYMTHRPYPAAPPPQSPAPPPPLPPPPSRLLLHQPCLAALPMWVAYVPLVFSVLQQCVLAFSSTLILVCFERQQPEVVVTAG